MWYLLKAGMPLVLLESLRWVRFNRIEKGLSSRMRCVYFFVEFLTMWWQKINPMWIAQRIFWGKKYWKVAIFWGKQSQSHQIKTVSSSTSPKLGKIPNFFFLSSLSSSPVWLIPLVNDPQTTWKTKLKKRPLYEGEVQPSSILTIQRPLGPPNLILFFPPSLSYGAFTLDVKSVLNENLGWHLRVIHPSVTWVIL
jgi:hypothetical protein